MSWSLLVAAGLGLIFGSFINVVIYRGPARWRLVDVETDRGGLAFPGSYCPHCRTPLQPHHLIPVISYLALGGKCAHCGAPISIRYPIVEIAGAIACVVAVTLFGLTVSAALAGLFFLTLIALAGIDLETGYLPNALTLPLLGVGLVANLGDRFIPFMDAAIGAGAGYLVFLAVAIGFEKLRGVEGLGLGDAKLLGAIGAWAGWTALAPTVFVAAISSLLVVLFLKLRGAEFTRETPIPFGPALAGAGAIIFALKDTTSFY